MSHNLMYFMYNHTHHCVLTNSKTPTPSSLIFHLFPLLPPELRLKIYHHIGLHPRTVELTCTPTTTHLPSGRWFSHTPPPPLLLVSREAHSVALSHYSPFNIGPETTGMKCSKPLWISWEVDTLWLCGDLHVEWARELLGTSEGLKRELRWLCVRRELWESLGEVAGTGTGDEAWRLVMTREEIQGGLKALRGIELR